MNEKTQMTRRLSIAFYLNLLLVLMGLGFGFRYIFAPELLRYHLDAMNVSSWSDVSVQYRLMLMVFMRVAGLGMTTSSICLALILFKAFRKKENWGRWGFLLIFTIHYIPLMINMIYLKLNTAASPPYLVNVLAIIMALTAFFLSNEMKTKKDQQALDISQ